ncbi:MAG: hypothetical protein AB7V32_10635, partial [Candidatus Berkiella sp.]
KLSFNDCMSLLQSTNQAVPFLIECAMNPAYARIAKCLFNQMSQLSYSRTGFYNNSDYAKFTDLLCKKFRHQSPLYYAACANNTVMIQALRAFDVPVSSAGPIDNPNALTAAAQNDCLQAVCDILSTKPRIPWLYENVERRLGDLNQRSVMHYLAMSEKPEVVDTMVLVLKSGIADFYSISSLTDNDGHSPLFYLLNNRIGIEILQSLCQKLGKNPHEIFDLTSKRSNGYSDLEWAFKENPFFAEAIANLTPNDASHQAQVKIVSDAREKIEAQVNADIMHLPAALYQHIKEERSKPKAKVLCSLDEIMVFDDYPQDDRSYTPLKLATKEKRVLGESESVPNTPEDKSKVGPNHKT